MSSRFCKTLVCALSLALSARADFIDLWANKLDMPLNKAPRAGHSRLLVIPVEIAFGKNPPVDRAALEQFFTAPPSADLFNFKGFYQRASGGRFSPEVAVAPLVRYDGCPAMLAGNAACTIGRGDVGALRSGMDFVRDVFRRAHDEGKVDFTQLDANGLGGAPDGVIDGAMIVINVPDVGIAFPIEYVNSGGNLAGGTGGALILDGVKIPYVAIGGVTQVAGKPRFDLVVLHEFGHVLGLADLYYEHPPMGDPYPNWQGLHFSLMGDYSYDERATLPDAESRRALGWQDLHLVSGTETITLRPAAAGGGAVKLGQMNGPRKEYFLVEARGPVGPYDLTTDGAGKPVWGLSVTHVDWSRGPKPEQGAWTERLISCLDCDPFHPFVRNLESSNLWGLLYSGPARKGGDGSLRGEGDDRVLFTQGALASIANAGPLSTTNRYTATNWYDGTESGIRIEDVTVNADHSVTATFTAPVVPNPCADVTCAPLEQCVSHGPRAGNCDPVAAVMPTGADAGTTPPPPVPKPLDGGCATSAGSSAAGILPLALLAALWIRRRKVPCTCTRTCTCSSPSSST